MDTQIFCLQTNTSIDSPSIAKAPTLEKELPIDKHKFTVHEKNWSESRRKILIIIIIIKSQLQKVTSGANWYNKCGYIDVFFYAGKYLCRVYPLQC